MGQITRRAFIGSSVAALSAGSGLAEDDLEISERGRDFLVYSGRSQWRLRYGSFGPRATMRKADGGLKAISISDVELPNGVATDITIEFRKASGQWTVRSLWRDWGQSESLKLGEFFNGTPLRTTLKSSDIAALARGEDLALPARAALELHPDASVSLHADKGYFALLGDLSAPRLLLAPRPDASPAGWLAEMKGMSIRDVNLGRLRKTSVGLRLGGDARIILQTGDLPVRIAGDLRLHVSSRGEELDAPVAAAEFKQSGNRRISKLTSSDAHWRLRSRAGSFELSSDDGGAPFTYSTEARGGTLTKFDMPCRVQNHNISVEGADRTSLDFVQSDGPQARLPDFFSRLDLAAARFNVFLPGPAPLGKPAGAFGYLLGASESKVRVSLDRAVLRMSRAKDLMNLAFRFKNLELELRSGRPFLVRSRTAPKDAEAILIVDFPPQHIMERAFLRQQFDLPDAEPQISEGELKRLLEGSDGEVEKLRHQIYDRKLANAPSETRFKEFATFWSSAPKVPPREKIWIGPQGLLSVQGRQAARLQFALFRTQKMSETIANLASARAPADADSDLAAAVGLIPLPPLGIDLGVQRTLAKGTNATGFAARLFAEARKDRFNHDLLNVLEAWEKNNGDIPLVLPNWPLRPEDWKELFPAEANPPLAPRDSARRFLGERLKLARSETAQDAPPGIDCSRYCETPEGLLLPVDARISGGSRLAFVFEKSEMPFEAEHLTDWRQLSLKVVRQAQRPYKASHPFEPEDSVAAILTHHGVSTGADSGRRLQDIERSIQQPSPYETALEVPSRLVLSPAQDAKWRTRRTVPKNLAFWREPAGSPGLTWEARLVEALATPSLRAVWSPDFDGTAAKKLKGPAPGPYAPWDARLDPSAKLDTLHRFRTSLDAADRHELVVLSSAHGLPVVGIPPKDKLSGGRDWGQVAPPPGYELSDIAKETIGSDADASDPSAIYLPRALSSNKLILGSLGATLDLDTTFEPPSAAAGARAGKTFQIFESFSIERWRSVIVEGRDVITTIVRRGYLFPLGHKAALVKVTEPRIRLADGSNPKSGYIVEQAQRFFIEVSRDRQIYPATGQLFAAREFPAKEIRLLTLRTPDLLDPTQEPQVRSGNLKTPLRTTLRGNVVGAVAGDAGEPGEPVAGLVFWPRTELGQAGTVRFRMLIDEKGAAVSMPLLFVDNRAANDPATVEAICNRYYSADIQDAKPVDHDLVLHNGADRKYADEQEPGQCTFRTDWQRLRAEGRPGFSFDGSLQAAAQPPFYPRLHNAQIRPQQIETLTGASAKPILVRYNKRYVENGFGDSVEDQSFLDLETPYSFDMGANGDRSGGVGRMALQVVSLNRKLGPVGSSKPAQAAAINNRVRYAAAGGVSIGGGGDGGSAPDFIRNFFPPGAKLLGLIEFRDFAALVTAATGENALPIIKEISQFSLPAEQIKSVFADGQPLETLIASLNTRIGDIGRSVFAELSTGLADLDAARKGALQFADNPEQLPVELGKVWAAAQRVLHALDEILRTPLAPVVERIRQAIADFREKLSPEFLKSLDPANALRKAVIEAVAIATGQGGPWADAVLFADQGVAADVLARARAASDRWRAIWSSKDPIAALLDDPAARQLAPEAQEQLRRDLEGPLYPEFMRVVDALNSVQEMAIDNAARTFERSIVQLIDAVVRFDTVARKGNAVCARGAGALQQTLLLLVPDLGVCPPPRLSISSDAPGTAACRTMDSALQAVSEAAREINAATQNRGSQFGAFKEVADKISNSLSAANRSLQTSITELNRLRTLLIAEVAAGSCEQLTGKVASKIRNLIAQRDALALACVNGAKLDLRLPEGLTPPEIEDSWSKLVEGYIQAAAALSVLSAALGPGTARTAEQNSALTVLSAELAANLLGDEATANVTAVLDDVAEIRRNADDVRSKATALLARANVSLSVAKIEIDRMATDARTLLLKARSREREILRLVLRQALAALLPAGLKNLYANTVRAGSSAIAALYNNILKIRTDTLVQAKKVDAIAQKVLGDPTCSNSWAETILLVRGPTGACSNADDQLATETKQAADANTALAAKAAPDISDAAPFQRLLALWQSNEAAPQKILSQVKNFLDHGARARLQQLLNVDAIRHQLDDQIRDLIPLRRTLTAKLDLPLEEITVANFVKFEPRVKRAPLVLSSRVDTHLSEMKVTSSFNGTVPAFDLSIPSIITVRFAKGITYGGGSGQSGKLSAPLKAEDVQFGPILKFLDALSKSLSLGGDDGPFTRLSLANPAIEAGYRISIPVITLGITFTNINFFGSMMLPLEDKPARIKFSLGTLESPFMISAGIYGGTGYFGLEGSARGIEAFESAFQFGGVASIGYGPLQGTAYVTSGVFVRQEGRKCVLSGIFSAGFTAHIACFSISAAFTLRLTPEGDGLVGRATLTFSFSVGLARVRYSVEAVRRMGSGFASAGSSATAALDASPIRLAAADGVIPAALWCRFEPDDNAPRNVVVVGASAGDHWGLHSRYFDRKLEPEPMDLR